MTCTFSVTSMSKGYWVKNWLKVCSWIVSHPGQQTFLSLILLFRFIVTEPRCIDQCASELEFHKILSANLQINFPDLSWFAFTPWSSNNDGNSCSANTWQDLRHWTRYLFKCMKIHSLKHFRVLTGLLSVQDSRLTQYARMVFLILASTLQIDHLSSHAPSFSSCWPFLSYSFLRLYGPWRSLCRSWSCSANLPILKEGVFQQRQSRFFKVPKYLQRWRRCFGWLRFINLGSLTFPWYDDIRKGEYFVCLVYCKSMTFPQKVDAN